MIFVTIVWLFFSQLQMLHLIQQKISAHLAPKKDRMNKTWNVKALCEPFHMFHIMPYCVFQKDITRFFHQKTYLKLFLGYEYIYNLIVWHLFCFICLFWSLWNYFHSITNLYSLCIVWFFMIRVIICSLVNV